MFDLQFTFLIEGSVVNYMIRFMEAVLSLEKTTTFWPREQERNDIKRRIKMETGFPDCLGFVDGTLIPLDYKPAWDGEMFYTLSAMIVCDDQKLIRIVYTGWSGSTHDARVFSNCPIMLNLTEYFDEKEYILADSAYPSLPNVVPAYRKTSLNGNRENTKFNARHSNLRVRVEHCIGLLKARWMSLRGLRRVIHNQNDVGYLCLWTRTCVVLHNLLIKQSDDFEMVNADVSDLALSAEYDTSSTQGISRREEVKRCVLDAQNQ